MAQQVPNYRRYCLLKRQLATVNEDSALAGVWQAKQEAAGGTELPSDFPLRARLVAAFYSTREDLDGAVASELTDLNCFTAREANTIFAAFNALEV